MWAIFSPISRIFNHGRKICHEPAAAYPLLNIPAGEEGKQNHGDQQTGFLLSALHQKIMSERQFEPHGCNGSLSPTPVELFPVTAEIPIQFTEDLPLGFPIKIQSTNRMNHLQIASERPLIPALFQIAACADDVKSISSLKQALSLNRMPFAEMMLDPEKIEAVLKSFSRAKKVSARRLSVSRFEGEAV
jgi:hypothetical protein